MNPLARTFEEAMGPERMAFWDKHTPIVIAEPDGSYMVEANGFYAFGPNFELVYDSVMKDE